MFEPVVYCSCGNLKEYGGDWQITSRSFKAAFMPLKERGSVISKEKCPICKCIDAGEILISLKNL